MPSPTSPTSAVVADRNSPIQLALAGVRTSPGIFTIVASPTSLGVVQGNKGTSTIATTVSGGFSNTISLSASGVPTVTAASFSLNPIPAPGAANSTLTLTVGSTTAVGTYAITVTGSGGGLLKSTTVTLTVTAPPNFTIAASPASLSVIRGYAIIVTGTGGGMQHSTTVNLTVAMHVALSWNASISSGVIGYNAYRSTTSEGPYTKLNTWIRRECCSVPSKWPRIQHFSPKCLQQSFDFPKA